MAGRQVTCGDASCRRRQHLEACRRWRQQNREVAAHHYADAIVPFRRRQPLYQRQWRFLQSLREIRDVIAPVLQQLGPALGRLRARGEGLVAARGDSDLAGERDRVGEAVAITRRIATSVDELTSLIRQLERIDPY